MLFKDVTQSRFMLWYQKMGVGSMRALHNAKTFGVESEEKRTEHLQIIMLHLLYYIGNFIRKKFQFSFTNCALSDLLILISVITYLTSLAQKKNDTHVARIGRF